MEIYKIGSDIKVICLEAKTFPDDVADAHHTIQASVPNYKARRVYGILMPNGESVIEYKAALEELNEGEAAKFNLKSFTIPKGEYFSIYIKDYYKDIPSIGQAFGEILKNPDIDPNGFCLEWFIQEKDVRCMVRVKN